MFSCTKIFSEKEECDIVDTMYKLMCDYIDENPTKISEPDFNDEMMDNVKELFIRTCGEWNDFFFGGNEEIDDEIEELMEVTAELFYTQIIPPRSFSNTFIRNGGGSGTCGGSSTCGGSGEHIAKTLEYLASKPQPAQRTEEWYTFRHNLITASNAYKAFENQNVQNQLIYEKCFTKPVPPPSSPSSASASQPQTSFVNVDSPLHWGQKYEPVSVMLYEDEYNTTVGDYGCIQHSTYPFLGASPDGINDQCESKRYGRMLEIKNIVNREIDGIPKKEYWIQMQLQMETCDLDECDFLETKFVEYESEEEFMKDGDSFVESPSGERKGIIMYFSKDGRPHYIYKPLDMGREECDKWLEKHIDDASGEHGVWIKNIYWKVEEYSCVLVLRNKKWFSDNIQQIENIWNIIEKERITGYAHRAPNKRTKPSEEKEKDKNESQQSQCFLYKSI